jgi:tellurite resistance protein TehA-like permease
MVSEAGNAAARGQVAHSGYRGVGAVIKAGIEELSPAYFALVMATGIISVALDMLGMADAAKALFVLNVVNYVVLAVLSSCRAMWFRNRFFGDMLDHNRGPVFLPRLPRHASSAFSA